MLLTRTANLFYDCVLAMVYPQACAVCGASVESRALGIACAKCWEKSRIFTGQETFCWKCGALSAGNIPEEKRDQVRCRRCDTDAFTAARACGVYEGAVRACVLSLKHTPYICLRLAEILHKAQRRAPLCEAQRIIPIPLHTDRQKARGFNQAAIIGHALSALTDLPLDEVSVVRTQHTDRYRAGMDAKDRRKTVEDAFEVRHSRLVSGEHILLVDDVFTTGATVSSCANALKNAGAKEVFVLTIARPLNH